jgi:hypothetical protein
MLELSVHQFVSHLPAEQQGQYLYDKQAFLAFLRQQFRSNEAAKRTLFEAAVHYARRDRIQVICLPDERQAAQAITYAYMRLGEELRIRGKVGPRQSRFKVYRTRPKPQKQPNRTTGTSYGRFHTVETTVNGRSEKIQQYPSDITWKEARAFQTNLDYELPDITLEPEYHTTGATAHFKANSYPTGWGRLYIDGECVDRIRCYPEGH